MDTYDYTKESSMILIFNCVFSILDPSTNKTVHSATPLNRECDADECNGPNRADRSIRNMLGYHDRNRRYQRTYEDNLEDFGIASFTQNDIDSYIFNDTLTIQVDSSILCISNPIEVKKEVHLIPTDYVCKQMKALLNDESFADVTIKLCNKEFKEFKVHKAILASQSPVFKTMFQTDMKEKSSNVLEISDMEPAVVSDLLEFMYTGKATNIKKLAKDLLYAANKYELPLLLKTCENELMVSLTFDNIGERMILVEQYQNVIQLKQSCFDTIKNHPAEIYKTGSWKEYLASHYCSGLLIQSPPVAQENVFSNPIKGHTSYPKECLSYTWVISDANVALKDLAKGLRSPVIPIYLKLESNEEEKLVNFCIQIDGSKESNNVFLCNDTSSSRFIISDCVFSILDPNTKEVYRARARNKECKKDDYIWCASLKQSEIDSYIFDDAVTIHVDATILCISNPIEIKEEADPLPTDCVHEQMKALLDDKSFADVTIKCGDEEFEVHKAILASQSPVFKTMFQTDMKEKSSNVLEISDMEPAVVSDLLEFMYTWKATNIKELVKDLLYAANKYQLPLLLKMCENELMMTLTADNVAEIVLLADRHQATELKQLCLEVIKSQPTKVYKTEGWKTFMVSNSTSDLLYEILEDEQSDLSSEIVPAKKPRLE